MKVTAADGVQVYELSAGKRLPQWISDRKRRTLSKDPEVSRRVDLVQDFEFPTGCGRVAYTPDGRYVIATGLYPPQVRCFELKETSMKFMRVLPAEIVQFTVLSDDYAKMAFLCNDRSIAVHAKFGSYHTFRIPAAGRDLCYNRATCDLMAVGSSSEVFRFNLHQGRFLASMQTRCDAIEACALSPAHGYGLLACAGADGTLECFDTRARSSVAHIRPGAAIPGQSHAGLTALRFDGGGFLLAAGSQTGLVSVFDLRSSRPLVVKDHLSDKRVTYVDFRKPTRAGGGKGGGGGMGGGGGGGASSPADPSAPSRFSALSADTRVCKLWRGDGETLANIEPSAGSINGVMAHQDDGLVVLAVEAPKLQVRKMERGGRKQREREREEREREREKERKRREREGTLGMACACGGVRVP